MTAENKLYAVTGAFGYSGSYIAARLLAEQKQVITLTNSPDRKSSLQGRIKAYPFNFNSRTELTDSLKGVSVLCNTYWVRFNSDSFCFSDAVKNSRILLEAARSAGVERIVHISITNPDPDSELGYFKGKAEVEAALKESGLSWAIIRPAVLFGKEDILINNIAWTVRNFPVIGIFGNGDYRLSPIFVGDLADLVFQHSQHRENVVVDAIGPESFSYRELVLEIARALGRKRKLMPISKGMGLAAAAMLGKLVGDVVVTPDELSGLMSGLLYVDAPAAGTTKLSEWLRQNAELLGKSYTSELARRKDRRKFIR